MNIKIIGTNAVSSICFTFLPPPFTEFSVVEPENRSHYERIGLTYRWFAIPLPADGEKKALPWYSRRLEPRMKLKCQSKIEILTARKKEAAINVSKIEILTARKKEAAIKARKKEAAIK